MDTDDDDVEEEQNPHGNKALHFEMKLIRQPCPFAVPFKIKTKFNIVSLQKLRRKKFFGLQLKEILT